MRKNNIYRKWFSPEEESTNYLLIHPSGLMLQITFFDGDDYGKKVTVYQTNKRNRLDPQVFIDHKEACPKYEFEDARKRAGQILKGDFMNLFLSKEK